MKGEFAYTIVRERERTGMGESRSRVGGGRERKEKGGSYNLEVRFPSNRTTFFHPHRMLVGSVVCILKATCSNTVA